ncbi:phage tail protein [Pseudoalteromonas sp. MMG013]|uniref:phage tail protein n=1 Tax=Pseudoalteromonas sp. MMG013 TaxID=2822687 RepID=UPI001B37D91B|nr:phage tail protein [Pseudoalteromonas sp. MMG013]MBQ4864592.1 phage tail protein [Pseudoalteromonas sp. MMG013]
MMMTLGYFVFERKTIAPQQTQHTMVWRHPSNNRVGARPSTQFLGTGDEIKILSGVLMPEFTGGEPSLKELTTMAETGKAYPLIDGSGNMHGFFVITKVTAGRSEFIINGAARKIEFSIELKRIDEKNTQQIANKLSQ